MIVSWSKVEMFSQGVFDVWFVCPHCKYESWARAYGVGEGFDTGVHKTASAAQAMVQANVMAEHAAVRAVHGSPCPRCSQHHPEVVRWAEQAAREIAKRKATHATARALFIAGIACAIGGVVLAVIGGLNVEEVIALAFVAAIPIGIGRVMTATSRPVRAHWVLYSRTAPGVTFQNPP